MTQDVALSKNASGRTTRPQSGRVSTFWRI